MDKMKKKMRSILQIANLPIKMPSPADREKKYFFPSKGQYPVIIPTSVAPRTRGKLTASGLTVRLPENVG